MQLKNKIQRHLECFQCFSRCGSVASVKLIVDIVTGSSQGYGFVEMGSEDEARRAARRLHDTVIKGSKILVDFECGRTMKGWKPRRLGTSIFFINY